jgi:hypothetical protein
MGGWIEKQTDIVLSVFVWLSWMIGNLTHNDNIVEQNTILSELDTFHMATFLQNYC